MDKTDDEVNSLSREELIHRVRSLEAHVNQLRNIISKQASNIEEKKQRDFDFTRYHKRHVALKVCYLGWDYQGLAVQEDTQKTIETELFNALIKTRLIESRETSNYHRCGRTDKEVSAFGQVLSIDLRSNRLIQTDDELGTENEVNTDKEINYCHILNKVLPAEIKILAWAPVKPEFSARFSCTSRTYKYVFPRGDLNIERMREAALSFIGTHDFRNLCKMDVGGGVTTFIRRIFDVSLDPIFSGFRPSYEMYCFTVKGQSFLWHQIRCMIAVLFLIGQGLEEPNVIKELLDVEKNPCKPQYDMAVGFPLILFDCQFEDVEWFYESEALSSTVERLQDLWSRYAIRADMIKTMLDSLELVYVEKRMGIPIKQSKSLLIGNRSKTYKPLLSRPRCGNRQLNNHVLHVKICRDYSTNVKLSLISILESLESRLKQVQKRRKKQ